MENIHGKQAGASFVFITAVTLLVIALHAIHLTADTPDDFAPIDIGLRVDEGYKTLAPRNLVLFDRMQWSDADEYKGWFSGSPLTQALLYASFSLAKPDILVARLTALIYFAALTLLILWSQRHMLHKQSLLFVAALLAVEPFLFFFSRVALFEVALGLIIVGGFVFVRFLRADRIWLPLLGVIVASMAGFFLVKVASLLYFFPSIVVLACFGLRKSTPRFALLIAGVALITIIGMLIYTQHIWMRRMDVPAFSHFFANPLSAHSPWVSGAAWLCIADMLRKKGRHLLNEPYFLAVAATVIGVPLLLSFFSYAPPRYYVAIVPAQVLMIAYWLGHYEDQVEGQADGSRLWRIMSSFVMSVGFFFVFWAVADLLVRITPLPHGESPGISAPMALKILLPAGFLSGIAAYWILQAKPRLGNNLAGRIPHALIFIAVATGMYQASSVWFSPSYASHEIRNRLQAEVPEEHAVIGDWAPFFALGTGIPAIYSGEGRNEGEVVFAICPSFYLNSGTQGDIAVMNSYMIRGVLLDEPMELGQYAGNAVMLHRMKYSDGDCRH